MEFIVVSSPWHVCQRERPSRWATVHWRSIVQPRHRPACDPGTDGQRPKPAVARARPRGKGPDGRRIATGSKLHLWQRKLPHPRLRRAHSTSALRRGWDRRHVLGGSVQRLGARLPGRASLAGSRTDGGVVSAQLTDKKTRSCSSFIMTRYRLIRYLIT